MESIADWTLLWRSAEQIAAFTRNIPEADIAAQAVWPDATGSYWHLNSTRERK